MNDEIDLERVLSDIDGPRDPSPEFDQRLRAELFGAHESTSAPTQLAARTTPVGRRRLIVIGAVAAAAAVIVGVSLASRPDQVVRTGDQATPSASNAPRPVDVDAARAACREFNATAFGALTRLDVVGPTNDIHLTTPAELTAAAERLSASFDQFIEVLPETGIDVASLRLDVDRIRLRLVQARAAAAGTAATDAPRATSSLSSIEPLLISLDRSLTAQGVSGCL